MFLLITPTALEEHSPVLIEFKTKQQQQQQQKTPGRDNYSRSHLRPLMRLEIFAHINFLFFRKFSRV